MLERCCVKNNIRFEFGHDAHDPRAIANVRDTALDRCRRIFRVQSFRHRMQCRLRVFDNQQPQRAKATARSQISDPIDPPPPVTTTDLSLMKLSSRP